MKNVRRWIASITAVVLLCVGGGLCYARYETKFLESYHIVQDGYEWDFNPAVGQPYDTKRFNKECAEEPLLPDFESALTAAETYLNLVKKNQALSENYYLKDGCFDDERGIWFFYLATEESIPGYAPLYFAISMYNGELLDFGSDYC